MFWVLFGQVRLQDNLGWRNALHELSSSRRNYRFWYKNHPNPSSYEKVRAIEVQPCHEARCGTPHQTHGWRVARGDSLCCETDLTLKMISDQNPLTWKLFVSSKQSRLLLGLFSSEIVYHRKKDPQGAASLNRTVLGSSDKTSPNLTRVLDVNWCNFLVRKA